MGNVVYLFRGTSRGWPGGRTARQLPLTYTTTDPFVATLFAVECRNHGPAVIYLAQRGRFPEVPPGPFDVSFQIKECSVTLAIPPDAFSMNAEAEVHVDDALRILADLGFAEVPARIHRRSHLDDALNESNRLGQRLSPDQVARFLESALGERP